MANNVLGTPLQPCSMDPLTGWFRDGCCNTDASDHGRHVVCIRATPAFLAYSKGRGNDLYYRGAPRKKTMMQYYSAPMRWVLESEARKPKRKIY